MVVPFALVTIRHCIDVLKDAFASQQLEIWDMKNNHIQVVPFRLKSRI